MKTLTKQQIERLKIAIADRERILPEQITDAEVFEYLDDICDDDGIHTHGNDDPEEWIYRSPEDRDEKIMWMIEGSYHSNGQDYLSLYSAAINIKQ